MGWEDCNLSRPWVNIKSIQFSTCNCEQIVYNRLQKYYKTLQERVVTMRHQVFNQGNVEKVGVATIRQDSGDEWVLEYYLQCYEGLGGEQLYSLRIDKSTPDGVLAEREETFALTESYKSAFEMAVAFYRGTVPPSVLLEMADEWCSSCIHTTW